MLRRAENTALSRFMLALCDVAGAAILPHFRNLPGIDNKLEDGFDPVTEGDRAAERAIRAMIEATYPDDGILGEEYGPKPSRSGRVWVLDPIDGTRAFVCGLPTWMTLIGLIEDEKAVIGAAHQAFVGETFLGNAEGAFAYRKGKRIARLRAADSTLAQARCGTTGPARYSAGSKERIYAALRSHVREFRQTPMPISLPWWQRVRWRSRSTPGFRPMTSRRSFPSSPAPAAASRAGAAAARSGAATSSPRPGRRCTRRCWRCWQISWQITR